ncbi:hypothetical protein ACHAWF_004504 [Thalassiosira exigua]
MEIDEPENDVLGKEEEEGGNGSTLPTASALVADSERLNPPGETVDMISSTATTPNGGSASASLDALQKSCLGNVTTTFEPLKVGLDDDSSIEDGDEDMFDDDAFAFGDEDFQALMSHEAMQRPTPMKPLHHHARSLHASSAALASQVTFQLHQSEFGLVALFRGGGRGGGHDVDDPPGAEEDEETEGLTYVPS